MSKPAAGTRIATNALTANMVAAYLLNAATISTNVNSVNGSDTLSVTGSGMSYDSGTDSLALTGAGFLQLTGAAYSALYNGGVALPSGAATILIGYKSAASNIPIFAFATNDPSSSGNYVPFNDGNTYIGAFYTSRYSFATPGGITFSNFNQVAITAAASGSILFYINGVLKNTHAALSTVNAGPSQHLGHNTDGGEVTGNIQFFYAWTRVLTAGELLTLVADPYGPIFTAAGGLLINPGGDGGMRPQLKGGING